MDEEEAGGGEEEGGAGWIMTFADLMSLLMCFFVLLLSFSEMDVLKFKQLAGSMKEAFGVQREVKAKDPPKGTSIIAQEFSPGRPTPSAIVEIRQQTTDESKENLDFGHAADDNEEVQDLKAALKKEMERQMKEQIAKMEELLEDEIEKGMLEVSEVNEEVMIRIREKGSFASGKAKLEKSFYPILSKIGQVLNGVNGQIVVSGHTDNIPIRTAIYPSNWVLSGARASSVVHHLTRYGKVPGDRIEIRAHGDTLPIAGNDTRQGRAKNRRIEISVRFQQFDAIKVEDLESSLETIRIQ